MNSVILRNTHNPLSVFDQMDQILDSFFSPKSASSSVFSRSPLADVKETDNEYVMTLEVPGLSEKDVEIKLDDQLLTISSRKVEEKEEKSKEKDEEKSAWLIKERKEYAFARSFTVPRDVDREAISARSEHGVLTVVLPKTEKVKPRLIEVQS